jgi:hypothetical protein
VLVLVNELRVSRPHRRSYAHAVPATLTSQFGCSRHLPSIERMLVLFRKRLGRRRLREQQHGEQKMAFSERPPFGRAAAGAATNLSAPLQNWTAYASSRGAVRGEWRAAAADFRERAGCTYTALALASTPRAAVSLSGRAGQHRNAVIR